MGNRTKIVEAQGDAQERTTDFTYDGIDRLLEVEQQGVSPSLVTAFRYDAMGNVVTVTDPESRTTTYTYDLLSRLTDVQQPGGQTVTYEYDDRSRLLRTISARDLVRAYGYLAWGGLEKVEEFDSLADADANPPVAPERTIAYTYDLRGNVETVSDDDSLTPSLLWSFTYDPQSRVDTATAHYVPGTAPVLDAAYDAFGDRVSLTLTDSGAPPRVQSWLYDAPGRLQAVCMPQDLPCDPSDLQTYTLRYQYDANDDLAQITHGNGAVTALTYRPEGPVDTITVTKGGQLHKLDYALDALLDVDSLEEWVGTTKLLPAGGGGGDPSFDYGYDGAERLTQAVYPEAFGLPAAEGFAYDGAGNRDADADLDGTGDGTFAYDANNRIEASPGRGYGFDADGNLTTITDGQPIPTTLATLAFDRTNRLEQYADLAGSTTATYRYDPFGRRIRKTVDDGSPQTTWYLWDGDDLLAEYDASGTRQVRYAYAGGFAPAQVAYGSPTETLYDVHTDHLDTPRMLTDASGTPVWRAAPAAYGAMQPDEDPDGDSNEVTFNLRFPGQYYDAETEHWDPALNSGAGGHVAGTGLHSNLHRYYDPSVGRYVSADPIGQLFDYSAPQLQLAISAGALRDPEPAEHDLNHLYSYVASNPLRAFDPSGLGQTTNLGGGTTVRVDKPHVPGQQTHAHVKTPKGTVVVNQDGTQSHKSQGNMGNLTKKAIDFLRRKGFRIPGLPPFYYVPDPCQYDPYGPLCPNPPNQCGGQL